MSRHKLIRNMDLDAELGDYDADDPYDDADDGMTDAERRQMKAGLKQARETLGDIPGLSDNDIEESLWYYYFDVEKTVNYILTSENHKIKGKSEATDSTTSIAAPGRSTAKARIPKLSEQAKLVKASGTVHEQQ